MGCAHGSSAQSSLPKPNRLFCRQLLFGRFNSIEHLCDEAGWADRAKVTNTTTLADSDAIPLVPCDQAGAQVVAVDGSSALLGLVVK